jgi:hypothetical protein
MDAHEIVDEIHQLEDRIEEQKTLCQELAVLLGNGMKMFKEIDANVQALQQYKSAHIGYDEIRYPKHSFLRRDEVLKAVGILDHEAIISKLSIGETTDE